MQPNPQRFVCGSVLGKFTSVKVMSGMPRLMWFRKLTNETSIRSLARSVTMALNSVPFQSELAPSFEGKAAPDCEFPPLPCAVVIVNGYNRRVIVLRSHL